MPHCECGEKRVIQHAQYEAEHQSPLQKESEMIDILEERAGSPIWNPLDRGEKESGSGCFALMGAVSIIKSRGSMEKCAT
jgi:hypothetical protein